jgi:hypothetical protein
LKRSPFRCLFADRFCSQSPMARMKVANSTQDVRRKRTASRRRERAALRSGKTTPQQLQKRNSWISDRRALRYDAASLSNALAAAA